jgi:glycosyltransferase 2 family protein
MRRALSLLSKATVSILLLYFSVHSIDLGTLGARLSRFESGWGVLALLLLTVQIVPFAVRWRNISAACGAHLAFSLAAQISFIATFFNQVLPSTVGGDGMRIWLFARKGAGWANATYSVLIDRIAGILVLAIIVMACLPLTFTLIHDPIARTVLVVVGLSVIAGTLVFVLIGQHFRQWFDRWLFTRHLAAASRITAALCRSRHDAAIIFACSVAIHLISAAAAWCCAKAIASPVSFTQIMLLVLPVLLIATLPVSIGGWGVRESGLMFAFAHAGLPQGDGLVISILFGAASFIVGMAGGIVWIAYGLQWRPVREAVAPKAMPRTYDP